MLGRILREMSNSPGPLSVLDISRRLGIGRSALEGMLETLVRPGKLREASVGDYDFSCGGQCSACSVCPSYRNGGKAKAKIGAYGPTGCGGTSLQGLSRAEGGV